MSPMPHYDLEDEENEREITNHVEKSIIEEKPPKHCISDVKSQHLVASNFNVSFTRVNIQSSLMNDRSSVGDELENSEPCESLNENEDGDKKFDKSSTGDINAAFKNVGYDIMGDVTIQTNLSLMSQLDLSACGTPLPIFTEVSDNFWVLRVL